MKQSISYFFLVEIAFGGLWERFRQVSSQGIAGPDRDQGCQQGLEGQDRIGQDHAAQH